MPRYYFHVREGDERYRDGAGVDLPDDEAAWFHAVRHAREMMFEAQAEPAAAPRRVLEIEDEEGWLLDALPLLDMLRAAA